MSDPSDQSDSNNSSDLDEEFKKLNKRKLTDAEIEYLSTLKIKLRHKVPEQHKIERNPRSKSLTKVQKEKFEKYHIIKVGLYNIKEDEIIKKNWFTFCKNHNWDANFPEPFINCIHGKHYIIPYMEDRLRFAQTLANKLPWRTLNSVLTRFKSLYGEQPKTKQARYTEKEDKIILKYMKNIDTKEKYKHRNFSKLSSILGRTRHSIFLRHQKLMRSNATVNDSNLKKNIIWTLGLSNELLKNLIDLTLSTNVNQLKNAVIPKIVWENMENKMNISKTELEQFWLFRLHLQLFSPKPIYMTDLKIKLIELLYIFQYTEYADLHWFELVKYFDGSTPAFLNRIFQNLLAESRGKIRKYTLKDKIAYLYDTKIPKLLKQNKDKFLKRVVFKNNVLSFLSEDVSKYNDIDKKDDDNDDDDDDDDDDGGVGGDVNDEFDESQDVKGINRMFNSDEEILD